MAPVIQLVTDAIPEFSEQSKAKSKGRKSATSKQNKSMIEAAHRMQIMKDESTKAAFQNLLINLVFCVPYVSSKASYQIPLVWTSGCGVVWQVYFLYVRVSGGVTRSFPRRMMVFVATNSAFQMCSSSRKRVAPGDATTTSVGSVSVGSELDGSSQQPSTFTREDMSTRSGGSSSRETTTAVSSASS